MAMRRKATKALTAVLVFIGILYAFSQWRTTRVVVPNFGTGSPEPADVTSAPSRIAVDLQVSLSALGQAANRFLPPTFGGKENDVLGNAATEDYVNWSITRGTVTVEPAGSDALRFFVPFTGNAQGHARFGVKKKNKGPLGWVEEMAGFTARQSGDVAGIATATVRPRLTPDWTVQPGLELAVGLSKAELGLLGDLDIK